MFQTEPAPAGSSSMELVGDSVVATKKKERAPPPPAVDSKLVQQRLLYAEQLKKFKSSNDDTESSITFPNSLSSSMRKMIHEVSY